MRIHRSRIVNVERIREIVQGQRRDWTVVLTDGTSLAASRRYHGRLREFASHG
jgi:DNA-binding LytR/AlgR family response regulator